MIESMACGTPVIAYECGSVPEVMEDGVTGFVVRDLDDAVKGVNRIRELSRSRCREVFERRFAAERMASDYVDVYKRLSDSEVERSNLSSAPRALVSA
jgi:glycosyltransferase involved in cell wall biosynthesis